MKRTHVLVFYQALQHNNIVEIQHLIQSNDLDLTTLQMYAETSLPEYAMKHGSVEAAWFLMSKDIFPEDWGQFTGQAWKSFLKKGWGMVRQKETSIPLDTYLKIVQIGIKTTGEKLPTYLQHILESSSPQIQQVKHHVVGVFHHWIDKMKLSLSEVENFDEYSNGDNKETDLSSSKKKTEKKTGVKKTTTPVKPIYVEPIKMDSLKPKKYKKNNL